MRGIEQIPWLYDAGMTILEHAGLGTFRTALTADARGRTLDLGCGTGRNLPLLIPPAGPVVGLDPNPAVLAAARRRAPRAFLVQGRAEALPFRDGAFDTVVSGLVFCSVAAPARGLSEIRRVLGRGGRLQMLEHVRSSSALAARIQDAAQPLWTWLTGGCHPNRDTEDAVRAAGFVIEPATRRAQGSMRLFAARAGRVPPRR